MKKIKVSMKLFKVVTFCGVIVFYFFSPVITFWFAYLCGVILDSCVGLKLVEGLNIIFNTTRFTRDLIPLMCGMIATFGCFFKSNNPINDKEDRKKQETEQKKTNM